MPNIITGKEFNDIYKKYSFVKILADKLKHHGFEYKEGLNIDSIKFNPTGTCSACGLYFTDIINAYMYFDFGNKFSYVTIPDEASVYIEKNKFKANMIILTNILHLSELFLQHIQLCNLFARKNEFALQYIIQQTEQNEQVCKIVVQQDGYALMYVKEQTEEICKLAVQQNSLALEFIKYPTEDDYCGCSTK